MANKNAKPPKKHQFKKGQSGNPLGGKIHNPAIRALRNLTVETYREVIELVLTGNLASLDQMIKDPNTSSLQVGVATAFKNACKYGNYDVIEKIAERIVGKIPEVINLNSINKNMNGELTKETLKAAFLDFKDKI